MNASDPKLPISQGVTFMAGPSSAHATSQVPNYSAEFRRRRVLNWFVLGLMYASYYLGRYNITLANPILREKFGWSKEQVGFIISSGFITYGLSTLFNGPLADRWGGRKTILIGAVGTVIFNIAFGLFGLSSVAVNALTFFSVLWAANCYFQSYGALSIVKVNAGWFHVKERGTFGGIFGIMIQAGRLGILAVGGWIISHLAWQWIYFIPAAILVVAFFLTYLYVVDGPEFAGFPVLDTGDASSGHDHIPVDTKYLLNMVFTNPVLLTIAAAEFCTGFVRHGIDQWFPSFMREVHHIQFDSKKFYLTAIGMPIGAILGGLIGGTASDRFFGSRRTPVVCLAYLGQAVFLVALKFFGNVSVNMAVMIFIGVSFFISASHSMLSGVASMDFGGKKAAASAAGLFDGMQYIAGSIIGWGLGWFLDRFGWDSWAYSLLGFSLVGAILMAKLWNATPEQSRQRYEQKSGKA